MEQEKDIFTLQRTYTFSDCCKALHVDFKTFKKWLATDNVNEHESTYDARVKYLTADQVETLALRHGRPWPPSGQQQEDTISPSAYKQLMEQLAITAQQAAQVHADQATLHTALETQKALQKAIEAQQAQIATIQQAQATRDQDNQQAAQRTIDTLRDHGDKIGSFTGTLTELRGRYQHSATERDKLAQEQQATAAKLEKLIVASEEQRTQLGMELDAITNNQTTALAMHDRAIAAKLDRLAAASEEQQQQLRLQLDTMTASQEAAAAKLETLTSTSELQQQQLRVMQSTLTTNHARQEALTNTSAAQDRQLEKLTTRIDTLQKQTQQEIEKQVKAATESIQAAFQAEFLALRQAVEKQARDIYAAIQSAEQDEARDIMQLAQQIEDNASKSVSRSEAEITTRRLEGVVKQLSALDQRIQADQAERERLTLLLTTSTPGQPPTTPQVPDAEKPQRGRHPKDQASAKDA